MRTQSIFNVLYSLFERIVNLPSIWTFKKYLHCILWQLVLSQFQRNMTVSSNGQVQFEHNKHVSSTPEYPKCAFLNVLSAYGVHTGLLLPNSSVCTHFWKRLDAKCQCGVNDSNLAPGFFLGDLVSYNSANSYFLLHKQYSNGGEFHEGRHLFVTTKSQSLIGQSSNGVTYIGSSWATCPKTDIRSYVLFTCVYIDFFIANGRLSTRCWGRCKQNINTFLLASVQLSR